MWPCKINSLGHPASLVPSQRNGSAGDGRPPIKATRTGGKLPTWCPNFHIEPHKKLKTRMGIFLAPASSKPDPLFP